MSPDAHLRDASALLHAEHAVARVLAEVRDPGALPGALLAAIGEELGWSVGALWSIDPGDPERLHCRATWCAPGSSAGPFAAASKRRRLGFGEGLPGRVAADGRPVWLADLPPDLPRARAASRAGLRSAFCFPLGTPGHARGALEFFASERREAGPDGLETLASLGARIGQHFERGRAEKALAAVEARRRAILDAAFDCIVTMDAEGRIVDVNPATERIFGHRVADLVGRDLADALIPPRLREAHRNGLRRYLETGEARLDHPMELSGLHADGTEFPVEVAVRRLEIPGPPTFTGFIRDVTRRREAEEALRVLADEQAALRRVATLVARGAHRDAVFATVIEEVGRLLDAHSANIVRFEDDGTGRVVGTWSLPGADNLPVGTRFAVEGDSVVPQIARSGRPGRVDDYQRVDSDLSRTVQSLGFRAAVGAPVVVEGRLWGAMIAARVAPLPFPPGTEDRIAGFTKLVAQALANAEAREQLAASRARIVAAGDAERRRLERNLHDGAQQRLVALSLSLRAAERRVLGDPAAARELMCEALEELDRALEELRELARGLHPAVLTQHGLGAALEALATRAPLAVDLHVELPERPHPAIEAAAYYVVSEALTNAVRHAGVDAISVDAISEDGRLLVTVRDEGVGGAVTDGGSGLRGLTDRVEALGGRLEIASPPGLGTTVRAVLPGEPSVDHQVEAPAADGAGAGSSRTTGTL